MRIAAERARQLAAEGYSPILDRERHKHGQLARAASCYALSSLSEGPEHLIPAAWPWTRAGWKPKDRVRDLERAGALIAAELDRLTGEAPSGNELPGQDVERIIAMEIYKGAGGTTATERNAALARYIVSALRKAGYLP